MIKLNIDESELILGCCSIQSISRIWACSHNWKQRVEFFLEQVRVIEHAVNTNLCKWILKYAPKLNIQPRFAYGPCLKIDQSIKMHGIFKHLELCNMSVFDVLYILNVSFGKHVANSARPLSCRIDASIFCAPNTSATVRFFKNKGWNRFHGTYIEIYGPDQNTDLSCFLRLFCSVDYLILRCGSLDNTGNYNISIKHATILEVDVGGSESTSLPALFQCVQHTFHMDTFPTCPCLETCHLVQQFLKMRYAPQYVNINNLPEALKTMLNCY